MVEREALSKCPKYWEITVEVGNDYGEPTYLEVRKYDTEDKFVNALENIGYYDIVIGIKEVIEYEINYNLG